MALNLDGIRYLRKMAIDGYIIKVDYEKVIRGVVVDVTNGM